MENKLEFIVIILSKYLNLKFKSGNKPLCCIRKIA
jgi:hypothetical protein